MSEPFWPSSIAPPSPSSYLPTSLPMQNSVEVQNVPLTALPLFLYFSFWRFLFISILGSFTFLGFKVKVWKLEIEYKCSALERIRGRLTGLMTSSPFSFWSCLNFIFLLICWYLLIMTNPFGDQNWVLGLDGRVEAPTAEKPGPRGRLRTQTGLSQCQLAPWVIPSPMAGWRNLKGCVTNYFYFFFNVFFSLEFFLTGSTQVHADALW